MVHAPNWTCKLCFCCFSVVGSVKAKASTLQEFLAVLSNIEPCKNWVALHHKKRERERARRILNTSKLPTLFLFLMRTSFRIICLLKNIFSTAGSWPVGRFWRCIVWQLRGTPDVPHISQEPLAGFSSLLCSACWMGWRWRAESFHTSYEHHMNILIFNNLHPIFNTSSRYSWGHGAMGSAQPDGFSQVSQIEPTV